MDDKALFRWTFEPERLFNLDGDQIECELDNYRLLVRDGEVEVIVPNLEALKGWPNLPEIRKEVKNGVERILDIRAIAEHKTYELNFEKKDIPESIHDDLETAIRVNASAQVQTETHIDFQVRDPEGEVTFDSKESRKRRSKKLGELIHEHYSTDPTAHFVVRRYQAAVKDEDNEFVHLFDILEALKDRFDTGNQSIRKRFEIEKGKFRDFCTLANNPSEKPVRQGRHRGQSVENLRDATEKEREIARQVAREMVFGYLRYLGEEKS